MASAATKRARKPDSLADKIEKHLAALRKGKKFYARADAIMAELEKEMTPEQIVALNAQGRKAKLVDKLAAKSQHFHGSYFRRYEIEVTDN